MIKLYVRGYNGQGFGSGFIRWFTFGTYSHVSLRFVIDGIDEEIESIQGSGVIRHKPYSHDEKSFDEFVVPCSDVQVLDAHINVLSLIGSKYDLAGIWGFMRRKNNHDPYKWFCSELVAYALYKIGYPISRREPYRETPTSVMESLRIYPENLK